MNIRFIRNIYIKYCVVNNNTILIFFNICFLKITLKGPQPVPGQIKYRTTCGSMLIVAREEGFGALYKGLLPKVMRLGPGGAIMLLVYEYSYEYLKERFL